MGTAAPDAASLHAENAADAAALTPFPPDTLHVSYVSFKSGYPLPGERD